MTKKKYSINWEDDLPISFEVDGVSYQSLEQVPDEEDRHKLEVMMTASFDAEFDEVVGEQQKSTGANPQNIVLGVFTLVAVVMLIIAAVSSFRAISKISKEMSAPGLVVDMVVKREFGNDTDRVGDDYYFPVVEYVSADGNSHIVPLVEGNSAPTYEIGDDVTVLYDPEHPLDARIRSLSSSALIWVLPTITGILGLTFLIAVTAVRKLMSVPPGKLSS